MFCLLPSLVFSITCQTCVVKVETTVPIISLSQALASEDGTLGLYKLYGDFDSGNYASSEMLTGKDISENDIVVYFRVAQIAKTRTTESINLSVEAERLENTDLEVEGVKGALTNTSDPIISNVVCLSSEVLQINYYNKSSNEISINLNYLIGRAVENVSLIYFTSTWKKTTGLAPGLYTSNIILSYITN